MSTRKFLITYVVYSIFLLDQIEKNSGVEIDASKEVFQKTMRARAKWGELPRQEDRPDEGSKGWD